MVSLNLKQEQKSIVVLDDTISTLYICDCYFHNETTLLEIYSLEFIKNISTQERAIEVTIIIIIICLITILSQCNTREKH